MPKPRSQTPKIIPSEKPEPPGEPLLSRLTFLGSSRHVLNFRVTDFRQLSGPEIHDFLEAHPNLLDETPLADSGNAYPYRNLWQGQNIAMKRFSIAPDNQVTVLPWGQEPAEGVIVISTRIQLLRVTHRWRPTRLVKIWNALPGVEPVRNFPCRQTALYKIWDRMQSIEVSPDRVAAVEEQADGPGLKPIQLVVAESSPGIEKQLANTDRKRDSCPDRYQRQGPTSNMKRFSIGTNNAVTVLPAGEQAVEGSMVFQTQPELLIASGEFPAARLVAIWNGLAGVEPVRKFQNRAIAAARIWKQIQTLEAPVPRPSKKPQEKRAVKKAAAAPAPTSGGASVSKKDQVLALLRAAEGATLHQIMEATGWQKHTVRGFLSGAVHKKMGLTVLSAMNKDGDRVYRLKR